MCEDRRRRRLVEMEEENDGWRWWLGFIYLIVFYLIIILFILFCIYLFKVFLLKNEKRLRKSKL